MATNLSISPGVVESHSTLEVSIVFNVLKDSQEEGCWLKGLQEFTMILSFVEIGKSVISIVPLVE